MRRAIISTLILGLAGCGPLPRQEEAGQPPVVVETLASTQVTATGQPLLLPARNPEVIISEYTIAPGAVLPVHKHPYSRYAVVLEGTLRVSRPGNPDVMDYAAGDVVIEMVDTWHYGSNIGDVPVRLIVVDQVEAGTSHTVLQEQ